MPTFERAGNATVGVVLEPLRQEKTGGPPVANVLVSMYRAIQRILAVLGGRLHLGDPGVDGAHTGHLDAQWRNVIAPPVANTAFAVPHDLQRVPVGYLVLRADRAVRVYDDPTNAHTSQVLWLAADAADAEITLLILPPPS